jgi:hypothetical protein
MWLRHRRTNTSSPATMWREVFELTYPQTPQQLQEIVTLIRSIGDIQQAVYLY